MGKEKEVKKVKVGEKGSIEENIEKLQRELDEAFAAAKGAPKIIEEDVIERGEEDKFAGEEINKTVMQESETPKKTYVTSYPHYESEAGESFNLFRSSKFYITVFGILLFGVILFKAPLFNYTTPFRPDNDLPQIEVGFRYYNNLFGKQTKVETVIKIGNEKFTVHIPMSEWVNMSKDKKLLVLRYIQK